MTSSSKSGKKSYRGADKWSRMSYLMQLAHMNVENPLTRSLSRYYMSQMCRISRKNVLRVSRNTKRTMCRRCQGLLIPGMTCTQRIQGRKRRYMLVTCNTCDCKQRLRVRKRQQQRQPSKIMQYLQRIDVDTWPTSPSYDGLATLVRQHLYSVPFENVWMHSANDANVGMCLIDFMDSGVLLSSPTVISDPTESMGRVNGLRALYKKIVQQYRGGLCFELNALFAWLLACIGYTVELLPAKVADRHGIFTGKHWTHVIILVTIPSVGDASQQYIVDVGFGLPPGYPMAYDESIAMNNAHDAECIHDTRIDHVHAHSTRSYRLYQTGAHVYIQWLMSHEDHASAVWPITQPLPYYQSRIMFEAGKRYTPHEYKAATEHVLSADSVFGREQIIVQSRETTTDTWTTNRGHRVYTRDTAHPAGYTSVVQQQQQQSDDDDDDDGGTYISQIFNL